MSTKQAPILPPATIGVLGGGQLGRMILLAARAMGYRAAVLDPGNPCSASPLADVAIAAPYSSLAAAVRLAKASTVLTYEFENIPAAVVKILKDHAHVPQGFEILAVSQDRLREKQAAASAGLETAPYWPINCPEDLGVLEQSGCFPILLKTRSGGYDGKGQRRLERPTDSRRWQELLPGEGPWIAEAVVPFKKELAVIITRSARGESYCFPVVENVHRWGILHRTTAPADVSPETAAAAAATARALAESLQLVGTMAVELFLLDDGRIFVNEIAPRPHNSGHWTLDGCSISQFEQHVRAICGLPLQEPAVLRPTIMINLLGQHLQSAARQRQDLPAAAHVHLYDKGEARRDRKMGHINITAADPADVRRLAAVVETMLNMEDDHAER